MDKNIKYIADKLPGDLQSRITRLPGRNMNISEIKLRAGFRPTVRINGENVRIVQRELTAKQVEEIFLSFCEYTVSAFEDQLKDGYLTLPGGHRVGVAGRFCKREGEYFPDSVTSLTIRISGTEKWNIPCGLTDFERGLLIIGKPHSGKTTLLKNLCGCFPGSNVAVCDERGELYSPGLECDFLTGIKKSVSVEQAVRCLDPQVIICDEIGGESEAEKILSAVNCGAKFICTAHGKSFEQAAARPDISKLLDCKVFDRRAVIENLSGHFFIKEIRNV